MEWHKLVFQLLPIFLILSAIGILRIITARDLKFKNDQREFLITLIDRFLLYSFIVLSMLFVLSTAIIIIKEVANDIG